LRHAAYLTRADLHWNMWLAMAAGGATGMVVSLLISRLVYLPFLQRGTTQFAMVMVTVAVSFILKNVLQIFSGANFYSYRLPPQQPVHLLGMVFTPRQLAIIGLAVASLLGLHLLLAAKGAWRAWAWEEIIKVQIFVRAATDSPRAGCGMTQ